MWISIAIQLTASGPFEPTCQLSSCLCGCRQLVSRACGNSMGPKVSYCFFSQPPRFFSFRRLSNFPGLASQIAKHIYTNFHFVFLLLLLSIGSCTISTVDQIRFLAFFLSLLITCLKPQSIPLAGVPNPAVSLGKFSATSWASASRFWDSPGFPLPHRKVLKKEVFQNGDQRLRLVCLLVLFLDLVFWEARSQTCRPSEHVQSSYGSFI